MCMLDSLNKVNSSLNPYMKDGEASLIKIHEYKLNIFTGGQIRVPLCAANKNIHDF